MSPRRAVLIAEYEAAVTRFATAVAAVPDDRWQLPLRPGAWSPAAVALHVALAYEVGARALRGDGPGMRRVVPAWAALLSRTLLLPVMLARGRFPQGARAAQEVQPDAERAAMIDKEAAISLLRLNADALVALLIAALDDPRIPRFTHAYFGTLPPQQVMRLVAAHTVHHAAQLHPLS
jgi:hypothetical protein